MAFIAALCATHKGTQALTVMYIHTYTYTVHSYTHDTEVRTTLKACYRTYYKNVHRQYVGVLRMYARKAFCNFGTCTYTRYGKSGSFR